jgi:hypothetical protein
MSKPRLFHSIWLVFLATLIMLLLTACGEGQVEELSIPPVQEPSKWIFYVSPSGNDTWSGTLEESNNNNKDGPFQTIQRAKDAVRSLLQEPQAEDIVVYIREGTYFLNTPLWFTSEDSGQDRYQVIYQNYPGESPIISGGEVLSGWESYDENIYTTTVNHEFAALFENGRTSVLARHPNQDPEVINPGSNVYMKVAGLFEGHEYAGFYFDPATFPVLENYDALELRVWNGGDRGFQHWRTYLGPVTQLSYEEQTLLANLDGITPASYNALGPGTDYYIQNALDLLDHPGEFYLEGSTLYYWPHQLPIGEQTIIAPKMKSIFKMEGFATELVRNITFEGLVICHTDREPYLWANADSSAAIFLLNAENIYIRGNRIHSIGGRGILGNGDNLQNITVESNLIYDIGDTAVQFNGWENSKLNSHHHILNNHIHHIGLISPHAMGLFINTSSHNRVAHNLFHDIPNAAINISGAWETDNPSSIENVIEFNEFHSVTLDYQDMGLIYIGYGGPDNQILNNYFHDSFIPFSWGGGIYMDEYAVGTTVKNNLIENLQREGNGYLVGLIEAGDIETLIQNNIMSYNNVEMGGVIWPREYCPQGGGCSNAAVTPPNDIDVIRNIFYNNDGPLYYFQFGHEQSWLRLADNNLFYNDRGIYMIHGIPDVTTLEEWRDIPDREYDQGSLTADPLFIDPENGDYRLRFDSPAYTLGFEDLNFADMGLRADFPFSPPDNTVDRMFITSDVAGDSANLKLSVGQQAQLNITARAASGYVVSPENYQVICTPEDNDIASTDNSGLIIGEQSGVTIIECSVTQDELTLSLPVYMLVEITTEEASQQIPPAISPPHFTPFLGILAEIDFETDRGMFKSSPSHNNWYISEEGGGHIYCGYSDDAYIDSTFGLVEWENYQVEAWIRIAGNTEINGGLRTRNSVSREWGSYSHTINAGSGFQGISQGYCGTDRCDIWQGINTAINQGEWYLLRAEVDGNQVRTYLNGRLMVTQVLDIRKYGNTGISALPGTTICVDDIIVRSLDRSRDAMPLASQGSIPGRGFTQQSVNVLLSVKDESSVIGTIPQGEEVFIIKWNPDQTWVIIRLDVTGLQGWVPADSIIIEEE